MTPVRSVEAIFEGSDRMVEKMFRMSAVAFFLQFSRVFLSCFIVNMAQFGGLHRNSQQVQHRHFVGRQFEECCDRFSHDIFPRADGYGVFDVTSVGAFHSASKIKNNQV